MYCNVNDDIFDDIQDLKFGLHIHILIQIWPYLIKKGSELFSYLLYRASRHKLGTIFGQKIILKLEFIQVKKFNTSYVLDWFIHLFTLKIESVSKNIIFDQKMMVKSGLEKNILKSLYAGRCFLSSTIACGACEGTELLRTEIVPVFFLI